MTETKRVSIPVEVRDIMKTYGTLKALESVSRDVASGEFGTLSGPSDTGNIRFDPEEIGVTREQILSEVEKIAAGYPEARFEETNCNPPSYCDPCGDMVEIIQNNVEALGGFRPTPVVGLGGTDARLWRYENIPAYVYGPFPTGMGSFDENVPIEDFLHVVRTHVLSAYDYLMAG
jgi:acetylornithine deacetylase/succinyl-diaminopimelate desuccinylase-like protein